ncbi:unnamed protein product, partial [Staurois parvus]
PRHWKLPHNDHILERKYPKKLNLRNNSEMFSCFPFWILDH